MGRRYLTPRQIGPPCRPIHPPWIAGRTGLAGSIALVATPADHDLPNTTAVTGFTNPFDLD